MFLFFKLPHDDHTASNQQTTGSTDVAFSNDEIHKPGLMESIRNKGVCEPMKYEHLSLLSCSIFDLTPTPT